jgi:hypothetical protein
MGTNPRLATRAVMSTGRSRCEAVSRAASRVEWPTSRRYRAGHTRAMNPTLAENAEGLSRSFSGNWNVDRSTLASGEGHPAIGTLSDLMGGDRSDPVFLTVTTSTIELNITAQFIRMDFHDVPSRAENSNWLLLHLPCKLARHGVQRQDDGAKRLLAGDWIAFCPWLLSDQTTSDVSTNIYI